jgi:hypothetical protein
MAPIKESTLWANRKCLLICSTVAIASMQYGIDTAAVGGLQAMSGFLMVFGYEDPASPLGYGIDVGNHASGVTEKISSANPESSQPYNSL